MTVKPTVCALDCPDTCAVLVHIDDSGRATKLTGDPAHPFTRGFLCGKVAQYLEREYHPDRLLHPLRRAGRKGSRGFERVTWDEALDEVAERLTRISREYGAESILPYSYAGTMGVLNNAGMDRRFFHRLGASRLDRTICSATGSAALTASQGIRIGLAPEQFAEARLIIAWGANVLGTNAHLWPFLVEARRRGARFYTIDPVKNRTGRAADHHFAINPGSDLALALGLMHVIVRDGLADDEYVAAHANGQEELCRRVEEYTPQRVAQLTGLAAEEIEQLARDYATTKPAAIRLNYGVQRSDQGGATVRAISALPVLTGQWKMRGGGAQLTTSGAFQLNTQALERADLGPLTRVVNMVQLGAALTELNDPPVKGLIVYNSNPAAVAPEQERVLTGLKREDLFTVVLEQFQTDTADYADFVLPVTTFLEHTDLYRAYGHYHLQMARPALAAPGEARSNVEIFRALAKRMGFAEACFDDSEDAMMRQLLDSGSPYLQGITLERLDEERSIPLPVPELPFANGGFTTASGKFEFGAERLAYRAPVESRFGDVDLSARYPLELISSKNDDSMNSTFGHRDGVDAQTDKVWIHAADAAARTIQDGDPVRVFNGRGSVLLHARVCEDVKRGVVRAPSTRWNKRSQCGWGVNRLISDRLTDIGGGATFYSCLVEIAPVV